MSKRAILIIIGVIILCSLIIHFILRMEGAKEQAFSMMPTVEVATAKAAKWQDQINATGNIAALNGVMVKPEISGRITKIYFQSGNYVEKGQPLFQIYPDILEAQLASNQAALALAQVDYQRAYDLYQKRVVSQQSLDQETSNLRTAQAAVDGTKAQLAQHNIVAPVSGRLGLKYVDVGDYVNAGDKLVNLQQIDPLKIEFSVPDRFLNEVKIGDTVSIMPSSTPDEVYRGKVYALDSAVNTDSQSFSMWAEIPNPYHKLLPGAYVYVILFAGTNKPVVTVPQTAVVYSPQGTYVFKIVDNKAVKTQITAGERFEDDIQITSGLKAGDVVVTAGQVKIFDGSEVKVSKNPTYDANTTPQPTIITFDTKPTTPPSDEAAITQDNPEAMTTTAAPEVHEETTATDGNETTATTQSGTQTPPASTTTSTPPASTGQAAGQ